MPARATNAGVNLVMPKLLRTTKPRTYTARPAAAQHRYCRYEESVLVVDNRAGAADHADGDERERGREMGRLVTSWRLIRTGPWAVALLAVSMMAPARGSDSALPKTPAAILIIRHAEKPGEGEMSDALTPKGEERARALYHLFEKSDARPQPVPKPDFIFATKTTKTSRRPQLTAAPLAEKLMLPVDDSFGKDEFERLDKELMTSPKYVGKTILICWHHGAIPQLAKTLGAANAPAVWPAHEFDRVWRLDFGRDGKVTFANQPQRILKGDSIK
jgi:hypothetical protein